MFRSADLIFSLGIVGIAGVTLLLGVAGLGPQAVFWAAILIVAFSLTLMIDLDRWALFLCAAVVAVVAYSPAIGVEFEHLRYAIPIYTEMFLGVSLFEILLAVAAVLSIAAHLRSDRRIKITPLVGAVALFAFLTAIAFLRAEDPAGKTELRLLIPFFLAFIVGTFLPPRARTLTWFRFGILLAIVAAGIRSYLLVANSIGFQHGDYLRVSVDTGDFLDVHGKGTSFGTRKRRTCRRSSHFRTAVVVGSTIDFTGYQPGWQFPFDPRLSLPED